MFHKFTHKKLLEMDETYILPILQCTCDSILCALGGESECA